MSTTGCKDTHHARSHDRRFGTNERRAFGQQQLSRDIFPLDKGYFVANQNARIMIGLGWIDRHTTVNRRTHASLV